MSTDIRQMYYAVYSRVVGISGFGKSLIEVETKLHYYLRYLSTVLQRQVDTWYKSGHLSKRYPHSFRVSEDGSPSNPSRQASNGLSVLCIFTEAMYRARSLPCPLTACYMPASSQAGMNDTALIIIDWTIGFVACGPNALRPLTLDLVITRPSSHANCLLQPADLDSQRNRAQARQSSNLMTIRTRFACALSRS
ncbi:hypothetical protein CHU98_g1443 [Xylaria longipes]|nr:hypothetical protein CHU98_g1443 [Xylaria longipes]